jgi:branched-chain amino acid transport system substrate-binding protein
MKKLYLGLIVLLVAALSVVACQPAPEEPAEEPAAEETMEEPAAEETEAPMAEETEEPMAEDTEEAMEETEEPMAEEPMGDAAAACDADPLGCAVVEAGDTIKIGYAGPTAGDYAAFGTDISQAGLVAVDDAEPLDGFNYELVIEDTQGTPEGGAAVANLFVSEPSMIAIAGHTFSGSTEAAIPIYDEAGYPMLSPSATNPTLTEMGSSVFNRIAFTDQVQGEQAAAYLYDTLGLTTLAIMHDGGAYGQGLAEVVQSEFEGLGGEVVAFEAITPGETDYSAPLAGIGALAPEGLYFGGYSAEAAVLANQLDVAGLGDAVFFSDDGTYGTDFLNLAGENAEGAYATSLIPPATQAKDEFDAKYEERFGTAPGVLSAFTWNGYDIVAALISVAQDVAILGDDGNLYFPRTQMVEGVRGLEGYEGLSGTISCNDVGECNTAGPTFYMVEGGEWVEAGM